MPDTPTDTAAAEDAELSFEQAYESLESLVREMESDEMPLTTLIGAYERGIQLHALCQKRLEEAQGRIEMIRRRASGETVTEPFDDQSDADSGASISLKDNAELF